MGGGFALVAQLDRVLPSEGKGREFESRQARHISALQVSDGLSPSGKATVFDTVIRWFESSQPSQYKLLILLYIL